ncbi:MAG TPA: DUF1587 domain-containing protein, partial [Vicinamibacterales bacterium]|nr:DUF1587 domain-containing protein [Vicinamibacterales bacterium]
MSTTLQKLLTVVVTATVTLTIASRDTQTAGAQRPSAASDRADASPASALLTEYCVTCHNARTKAGGLALDGLNISRVGGDAAAWEKVVRKLRTGMMPPSGARRPARVVLDTLASDLETRLDQAAIPGAGLDTPALHRLNRTEYSNAIRDLLALDVDVTT